MPAPVLTVVVPCYDEEEVLPETARRLGALLAGMVGEGLVAPTSAVCFVDDGSRDRTWELITDLAADDPVVRGLRLSRNRGHQNALLAGLLSVPGDLLVSIDADLQDDPALIRAMVEGAARGADIVYAVRADRATDTAFKRSSARAFYRFLARLGADVVPDHADFRLMSRRAVEALRDYGEVNLFLRAIIPQLGFRTETLSYERAARFAGTSKYPLRKMAALAIEGITSFSTTPLRLVTVLGLALSVFAAGLTIWALVAALAFQAVIPGWASTVIPIYVVCGAQLLSLGIIGEYVGKIYLETKARPRFVIQDATPHVLPLVPTRIGPPGWPAGEPGPR